MPLSDTELNRITDYIVASDFTIRIHDGNPGDDGTANRIGSIERTLTAGKWSAASNGDVRYEDAVAFGNLTADPEVSGEVIVRWYSLWRGNFIIREAFSAPVTVAANTGFSIAINTISINGSSS